MEDSFSDVISMVPVVYPKNTDTGPDLEKLIIDSDKFIGNAQFVSETVSEGFKAFMVQQIFLGYIMVSKLRKLLVFPSINMVRIIISV